MQKNLSSIKIVVIGLMLLTSLLLFGLFAIFTVDDAWITFRYGLNLIEHGVWNYHPYPIERVEAYTNALYAFLSIIPHALEMPVVLFFKLIAIIILGCFVLQILKYRNLNAAVLGMLLLGTSAFFFVHLVSCLETGIFMLLIFIVSLKNEDFFSEKKLLITIAFLFPLIRPEGALFSAVLGLWAIQRKDWKSVKALVFTGLVLGIYYAIRTYFFESNFPNPFYMKTVKYYSLNILDSLKSSYFFWIPTVILLALTKRKSAFIWFVLSLGIWVFLYSPSVLFMNYAARFPFQIFFPLLLSAVVSAGLYISNPDISQLRKISIIAVCLFSVVLWGHKSYQEKNELFYLIKYSTSSDASHKPLALELNKFNPLRIMLGDVGIFGYFSKSHIIDLAGLAHKKIARQSLTLDMMKAESPDLIFLYAQKRDPADILDVLQQKVVKEYIDQHGGFEVISYIRCLDVNVLV